MVVSCHHSLCEYCPIFPSNFRGNIQRLDEITSLLGDRIIRQLRISSLRAWVSNGFLWSYGVRQLKMEQALFAGNNVIGFVGFMWHYGCFDGLLSSARCVYPWGKTTETISAAASLVYCMAFTSIGQNFCWYYSGILIDMKEWNEMKQEWNGMVAWNRITIPRDQWTWTLPTE